MAGKGRRSTDTGTAGRVAAPRNCATCGRYVLRGLDREYGGITVDVDPRPLSPLGEAMAIYGGFTTYELRYIGMDLLIERRNHFSIAARPAAITVDVLVSHQCDQPNSWPSAVSVLAKLSTDSTALPVDPPF